jgi:glycosyltransferase involved in cell wall biosynthesis
MFIFFLTPYPLNEAPSQRFRFEQYIQLLKDSGFSVNVQSFLPESTWKVFYSRGNTFQKITLLVSGFIRRMSVLFKFKSFQYIFIHREAAPIGPPIFEWFIAKVFRKKIIYDFDDAIWLTDKTNESKLEKIIRWRGKVSAICKWSYKVSCGNEYLATYARQFNANVVVNPTTIDTGQVHNLSQYKRASLSYRSDEAPPQRGQGGEVVIGWTGSHSTLKYLISLEPVLQTIEQENLNVSFLVIADCKPELNLNKLNFVLWNKRTEVSDLLKMDIGIMPLPDDDWAKGKCGFKALQYMAMEIPCVVSPVGVNTSIVDHGVNGYLAASAAEWKNYLIRLITDSALRKKLGEAGRQKVIHDYSVLSNTKNFLELFS